MQKKFLSLLVVFVMLFSIIPTIPTQAASKFTLQGPDEITGVVNNGTYITLTLFENGIEVQDEYALENVKSSLSKKGIVKIEGQYVQVLKPGDVTITFTYKDAKKKVKFHAVSSAIAVGESIKNTHNIFIGDFLSFSTYGKDFGYENKVTFSSSNSKVVKIKNGEYGPDVRVVGTGTTTITAKSNGKTLKTKIAVHPKLNISITKIKAKHDKKGMTTSVTYTVKNSSKKPVTIKYAGASFGDYNSGGTTRTPLTKEVTIKGGQSATVTSKGVADEYRPSLYISYCGVERIVFFDEKGKMDY